MKDRRLPIGLTTISILGVIALSQYEGFRTEAYLDLVGKPTIGYGSTEGVRLGDSITIEAARERLEREISTKYGKELKNCIKVPLYQHEYDSFVSLAYNIGSGKFCKSTLVKKLNKDDYEGACNEILKWDYAGGKKVNGLTIRRQKEHKMCKGEE